MFYIFSKILDFRIFSCIKKLIYFQKIFGSPIYPINYLQSLIYPLTVDVGCSATSTKLPCPKPSKVQEQMISKIEKLKIWFYK